MPKKWSKNGTNINFGFKQMSQCDTCFYMHVSRTFQKYNFISLALVTTKNMGYFKFVFSQNGLFYSPLPYPIIFLFFNKNHLDYYSFQVKKKLHGESVKNEIAKTKKLCGGTPNAPPPACLGLRNCRYFCYQ